MSDLVRLNPLRWPYSLAQLRVDEPTKSFSPAPSTAELAHYGCYRVLPQQQPEFDPAVERVQEVAPIEDGGQWLQQWELVPLTEAEQEAYYRANNPPRWIEFWAALPADVDALLAAARAASQRLGASLEIGLGKAADGDSRVFLLAWQQAKSLGLIPPELVAGVQGLAVAFDLPAEFVGGLE
jgi:hypothetical protein